MKFQQSFKFNEPVFHLHGWQQEITNVEKKASKKGINPLNLEYRIFTSTIQYFIHMGRLEDQTPHQVAWDEREVKLFLNEK